MKKYALIIIVIMQVITLSAQDREAGIYFGPHLTQVKIQDPQFNADSKLGYQVGVFYRKGNLLFLQVGVEYMSSHTGISFLDSTGVFSPDDINFSLLKLPLFVGINLFPITKEILNGRIYAGPSFAYLIESPINELDVSVPELKKIKMDISVGAGIDILLLSIDLSYNFGLTEMFEENIFDTKAHYAALNLGLHF